MNVFRISGTFKMGSYWQKFSKELMAKDEKTAVEALYSDMGGKHGVNRTQVKIEGVESIKPEDVENLVLRQSIEHKLVKK